MAGLAWLFPGQASQYVGMGADLRASSPRARELFDLADRITGLPITRTCEEGPLDRLTDTEIAQPAVVTVSLAALAIAREHWAGEELVGVAGHSVGELAAYAAAGVLSVEACLRLVHVRAQAMAAACRQTASGMAAVLGLDDEPLDRICAQASSTGSTVEVANVNAPGQVVISGERTALERAANLAREAGARRVIPLNVAGAFHSRYMQPAADALASAVGSESFGNPRCIVIGNVSAQQLGNAEALRAQLPNQVAQRVLWSASLQRLRDLGCVRFLELGPGQALTGMVKRTLPDAAVASFGALADEPKARAALFSPVEPAR